MNITENYVSFETAKLLKEKEFDEKCQKVYMHNGQLLWAQIFMEGESFVDNKCIEAVANYNDGVTYTQGEYAYLCPTLQMTMKWLREIHKLDIDVSIEYKNSKKVYYYSILKKTVIRDIDCLHSETNFDSYEEACEAAIKYCLENLILSINGNNYR